MEFISVQLYSDSLIQPAADIHNTVLHIRSSNNIGPPATASLSSYSYFSWVGLENQQENGGLPLQYMDISELSARRDGWIYCLSDQAASRSIAVLYCKFIVQLVIAALKASIWHRLTKQQGLLRKPDITIAAYLLSTTYPRAGGEAIILWTYCAQWYLEKWIVSECKALLLCRLILWEWKSFWIMTVLKIFWFLNIQIVKLHN